MRGRLLWFLVHHHLQMSCHVALPGQCPQSRLWVPRPSKACGGPGGHLVFCVNLLGFAPSPFSTFLGSSSSNPVHPLSEALFRKSRLTVSLLHLFNPPNNLASGPCNESWLGHIRVTLLSSAVTLPDFSMSDHLYCFPGSTVTHFWVPSSGPLLLSLL